MKQSLPNITAIYYVPCASLIPNITEKHRAGLPVAIFPLPSSIEQYGNASCEAEQEYDNGGYLEKTVLQFNTTDDLSHYPPLAFVVTDADGQSYIIGTKEAPYPIMEITQTIDKEVHVNTVKVTFTRPKSLVPCVV
jgi:hypothetical protein